MEPKPAPWLQAQRLLQIPVKGEEKTPSSDEGFSSWSFVPCLFFPSFFAELKA